MTIGKKHHDYVAQVLEGYSSRIPALTGCRDMSKLDIHYSVRTGAFIVPGPGGLNLGASPGTEIVQMRRQYESSHWFLPVGGHLYKTWFDLPEEVKIYWMKVGIESRRNSR